MEKKKKEQRYKMRYQSQADSKIHTRTIEPTNTETETGKRYRDTEGAV